MAVSDEGTTTIHYAATDRAGNVESGHDVTVKVDTPRPGGHLPVRRHVARRQRHRHLRRERHRVRRHGRGVHPADRGGRRVEDAHSAVTRTVCDNAGNCVPARLAGRIDRRAPSITFAHPSSTTFARGEVIALTRFVQRRRLGHRRLTGPATLDAEQAGSFAATAKAADEVGNTTSQAWRYTVLGKLPKLGLKTRRGLKVALTSPVAATVKISGGVRAVRVTLQPGVTRVVRLKPRQGRRTVSLKLVTTAGRLTRTEVRRVRLRRCDLVSGPRARLDSHRGHGRSGRSAAQAGGDVRTRHRTCRGRLLRRRAARPRARLSQRRGGRAVAARRPRPGGAVPLGSAARAGHRDRRPARSATTRRRSARCSPRRSATPSRSWSPRCCCAGSRGDAPGSSAWPTCSRFVAVRARRGAGQRRVRTAGAAARRRDPDRRAREVFRTWTLGDAAGVLVVAPVILTWATGGVEGHRPARARRGRRRARRCSWRSPSSRRSATCRTSSSRCCCGRRALRTARCRHGGPRRLLDHRLEDGAERRAVRARLDHRQPARDAAVHRRRGASRRWCSPP